MPIARLRSVSPTGSIEPLDLNLSDGAPPSRLTRRAVLIGSGTAGALVIGLALVPRHYRAPLVAGDGEHLIDGLIRLARDGSISVAVPATEMGQGVTTLAAQIVAVELGADWRRVGVEPAPLSPFYADPVIAAAWADVAAARDRGRSICRRYAGRRIGRGAGRCLGALSGGSGPGAGDRQRHDAGRV